MCVCVRVCVAAAVASAASGPRMHTRTALWEQSESTPLRFAAPHPLIRAISFGRKTLAGLGVCKPTTAVGTTKLASPRASLRAGFLNTIMIMINRCLI